MLSASEQAIAQAALAPGPHAIISADREGIIRDWNETAEHIFGQEPGYNLFNILRLVVVTGIDQDASLRAGDGCEASRPEAWDQGPMACTAARS